MRDRWLDRLAVALLIGVVVLTVVMWWWMNAGLPIILKSGPVP
jgi:hypothetical protein